MKTKEFILSKEIEEVNDYELDNDVHIATKEEVIRVEKIKEFIRLLKEEIREIGFNYPTAEKKFKIIIDKLAGDKLI
jgi:hypothetical protein